MPAKTTVGIVQMCATAAVEDNLDRTLALVAEAESSLANRGMFE